MSDQDEGARLNALLEETREKCKPFVEAIAAGMTKAYTAAAEMAGDDITPANQGFWQIAGNLFVANRSLNPAGSEVARLVILSKAASLASGYEAWASAHAVCDRLFEALDGGEELGLSDAWLDTNWRDETQRSEALRKGMQFHRVPRTYQCAVADVIAQLMLASPAWETEDGHQLPQPWAQCCTYVVFAIAERVKATEGRFH